MTPPPPHPTRARPAASDRGSVAVELALSVPLVVALLALLHTSFHLARATVDVTTTAAAAARAASLTRTPTAATAAAADTAAANLTGRCTHLHVTVDTTAFHRGGAVTVTIACTLTTRALTRLALPGTLTTRASSTSPLDTYRNLPTATATSNPHHQGAPPGRQPVSPTTPHRAGPAPAPQRRTARRSRPAADAGVATVWMVLTTFTAVLITAVILAGAAVLGARAHGLDLAQQAARAGAQQIDTTAYRTSGLLRLDPARAVTAARRFLTAASATGHVTATPTRVTVTATSRQPTPTLAGFGVTTLTVTATASAAPTTTPTP